MEFENLDIISPQDKKIKRMRMFMDYGAIVLIAGFIAMFVTTYVLMRVQISGKSMEPTLYHGEKYFAFITDNVEVNDIVVVHIDGKDDMWVKRVVAVEGEKVENRGGDIVVTDVAGKERIAHTGFTGEFKTIIVPDDNIFVMGDNINDSYDSTEVDIGTIEKHEIIGKLLK